MSGRQDGGGVRYELLLESATAARICYRGSVRIDEAVGDAQLVAERGTSEASYALAVDVIRADEGADGLSVEASCPDAPAAGRAVLERTAGIMARSAVRGAHKNRLPPPRRVRRWRPLPRDLARSSG